MLLSLLPLLVEGCMQLIPVAGVILSKLLVPLIGAWVLALIDRLARTGTFSVGAATALLSSRSLPLLMLSVVFLAVFFLQVLFAALLGGVDQGLALATGEVLSLRFSRVQMACILVSGLLPGTLLGFASPRVLFDRRGVAQGISDSVGAVLCYWRPVLAYSLVVAALVAGLLWMPWLLLVLCPLSTCIGYVAYRDVFAHGQGPVAE